MIDLAGFLTPGEVSLQLAIIGQLQIVFIVRAAVSNHRSAIRLRTDSMGEPSAFPTPACAQESRIAERVAALEKDTGVKLRVLAQNYPETPGEGRRPGLMHDQASLYTPCPNSCL